MVGEKSPETGKRVLKLNRYRTFRVRLSEGEWFTTREVRVEDPTVAIADVIRGLSETNYNSFGYKADFMNYRKLDGEMLQTDQSGRTFIVATWETVDGSGERPELTFEFDTIDEKTVQLSEGELGDVDFEVSTEVLVEN